MPDDTHSELTNPVLDRMRSGDVALGMNVRLGRSADIARIAKSTGHDFVFIDAQHGIFGLETIAHIANAALALGIAPQQLDFRAARRPASHQMTISAPSSVAANEAGASEVVVNVFAGSPRTRVEMRLGGDARWRALEPSARKDPLYVELFEREVARDGGEFQPLPEPVLSEHLWVGRLPADPPRGTFVLEVRARDPHLGTLTGRRLIRVE